MNIISLKSQFIFTFFLFRRYQSILIAIFLYPLIVGVFYFFKDSFQLEFFLTSIILFLIWSLGSLITNQLAILPRDLVSYILFPIKWLFLIIVRNSLIFVIALISILLIFVLSFLLFNVDISSLIFLFIHSVIVVVILIGIGNMLSVTFPKPFPQNAFSWKGFAIMFVTITLYGILGIFSLLGSFWYLSVLIIMFILSGLFYHFSVSRSARTLSNNLQDILELVNE